MDTAIITAERLQRARLQTIVVATDGSADTHCALDVASDIATRAGAALHVVTAPDAIVQSADTLGADLVVVGDRERDGLRRTPAGSTPGAVMHAAHRPVLVVHGGPVCWPPVRVVVGFDHSHQAKAAALLGATIAQLYPDAEVGLVEVATHTPVEATSHVGFGDLIEAEHGHLERHAASLEPVAGRPLTATMAVSDDIAGELVAQAAGPGGPSLLVVGTRGRGGVRRFLLGSVSTKLLHVGHMSLLVVPGGAADADHDEADGS